MINNKNKRKHTGRLHKINMMLITNVKKTLNGVNDKWKMHKNGALTVGGLLFTECSLVYVLS